MSAKLDLFASAFMPQKCILVFVLAHTARKYFMVLDKKYTVVL